MMRWRWCASGFSSSRSSHGCRYWRSLPWTDDCEAKAIHALTDAAKLGYPPVQGRLGLRYLDFTVQQIRWTPELWLKLNARYPDDPALLQNKCQTTDSQRIASEFVV
ncbi:hypothetical protein ACXIUT_07030 [Achromobacter denitrificans]